MPRGIPNARSPEEMELLINVVSKHVRVLECPGRSSVPRQRKVDAWNSIEKEFNSSNKRSRRATRHELQLLWGSLKAKARRLRKSAGSKSPLSDDFAAVVERILQEVSVSRPRTDDDSSSTESEDESPQNGYENRVQPTITRRSTVDYCPRPQFLIPASGAQNRISSLPTPEGPRPVFSPAPSPRPLYHGPAVGQQLFGHPQGTFRHVVPVVPPVPQPSIISISSTPTSFPAPGMGPRNFAVYAPPISAMGSSGSLPRATFRPGPPVQQQPVTQLQPPPLSPRVDDASRMHYIQEAQTLIWIKHIQALEAMEKTLQENKMRTEDMLATWTKELQEARRQLSAASSEGKSVMDELLQKRDEKLHAAKMNFEEMNTNKQRELHDIRIETAKVEHQMAEINKRIYEVKLEQVEMELRYLKENGQEKFAKTAT